MKRLSILAFILIASIACAGARSDCGEVRWSAAPAHMTNPIRAPFVVRKIEGRLIPTFTEAWPSDAGAFPATFEIHRNGGETVIVPIAPDGSFDFATPEGTYCFRVSSDSLMGYEGTIVVTRSAPGGSRVHIKMDIGA